MHSLADTSSIQYHEAVSWNSEPFVADFTNRFRIVIITDGSGGSRILKRVVRVIRCAKSGKNFCLTTPTFSETTPIKSPVYLVRVRSHQK